ncbi:MAG: right-handed parallel beta-helix repeat-containing protein, partial [Thermoplasmata archaeon]|nr:right-handed parallel beta-helix repeat-containing protein [Thermoplasmata archaeon]
MQANEVCSQTMPPANGDWIIQDTTVINGNTILLNGNLTVKNGGILTLDTVNLTINSTTDGEFGIYVEDGGELYIYNSTISPCNSSFHYKVTINGKLEMYDSDVGYFWGIKTPLSYLGGFQIYSDDVVILDSRIHHGQWNGVVIASASPTLIGNQIDSNNNTGVHIYNVEDLIFIENNIINNNYGILMEDSNATISKCIIKNNNIGIHYGPFTSPIVENCSLSNYDYDYYLVVTIFMPIPVEEIYPISLNTTFNPAKVLIIPGNVNLTVKWPLNVKLINGHGYPFPDANVCVLDKFDHEIYNGTTNNDGNIEWIRCTEYIQNSTAKIKYTNHSAFAKYNNFIAYAEPDPFMDSYKWITISFAPLIPPNTPTGLTAIPIPENNSINLTWDPNTELDLAHYNLYVSKNNLTFSPLATIPAGSEQYIHENIIENKSYYYIISATDIYSLNSDFSEPVRAVIGIDDDENGTNGTNGTDVGGDNPWILPPENLTVTIIETGNTLNISWDDRLDEEIHHYTLYRCVKNQPFAWLINIPKGREYFIDTNLVDG